MKALKTMFEHGPVDFFEHGEADLDAVGGIHADDVTIERGMMQLHNASPFDTCGSPPGSRSAMMCAAWRSSL